MQSERKFIIRENLTQLADLLDVDDNLIGDLVSRGCFTDQQLAGVVNSADHNERNTKLLHVFMRSSVNNLNVLLEYLKASQPHVVPLLTGNKGLHCLHVYGCLPPLKMFKICYG